MVFKYLSASAIDCNITAPSSCVNVTVPLKSFISASLCHTLLLLPNTLLSKPNLAVVSASVGPPAYSVCHTIPISALLICPANSEFAGTVYTIVLGLNAITSSPSILVICKSSLENNMSPCATVFQVNPFKLLRAVINLFCNPSAG